MMLDCFMKAMIRFRNAPLAIVISAQSWRAAEEQKSRQRRPGHGYLSSTKNSRLKSGLHPVLLQFE
jgi:ribosomal protein L19E